MTLSLFRVAVGLSMAFNPFSLSLCVCSLLSRIIPVIYFLGKSPMRHHVVILVALLTLWSQQGNRERKVVGNSNLLRM